MTIKSENVGIIIPTYNAGKAWLTWLVKFEKQVFKPYYRLIIDSSSTDSTVKLAKKHGFNAVTIKKEEFDHGSTRQIGVDKLKRLVKIIIFMTQDAILSHKESLKNIIIPFKDEEIAAVCGKIYTIFLTPQYFLARLRSMKSWEDIKFNLRGVKAVLGHLKDFSLK